MIVAAALIRHEVCPASTDPESPIRLLAAQRSYPASLAGRWEFPGGKVEDGESPREALRREIREELGIEIDIRDRLRSPTGGDWPLPNGMDMRMWLARPLGEPRQGASHLRLRWISLNDIHALDWLEGDLPILNPLVEALAR